MTKIIGIGGCSRSGKSLLAQRIKKGAIEQHVLLLDMDDFVFPEADIPKIRERTDWERPESVDFQRLCQAVEGAKEDYDLIIVEGILIYSNPQLRNMFDTTIRMEISKETFLKRRKQETRWGQEPNWFIDHVWESYLQYGQFSDADFVLSGEEEVLATSINEILLS